MPQDPGQAGKDQAETYRRELAGFDVRTRPVSGDKVQRAGPWSSQVGARNVALVRGPWTPGYVAQHHAFPDGPHDDKVDASAQAFNELVMGGRTVTREALRATVGTLRGRESPFRPRF
jgi:predicted phage terminase large subunit-like protein